MHIRVCSTASLPVGSALVGLPPQPASDSATAVIFLSNRVHPDGKGNVTKLRGQVATIVGEALVGK